jgi:hypothetical protein
MSAAALVGGAAVPAPVRAQATIPAAAAAATRPADPFWQSRPTEQELRSPSFWVERAFAGADRIDDRRARGDALWAAGVSAFDAGRFDLVRRAMARPELDEEARGTLAFRLVSAFEAAGDAGRVLDVAAGLEEGFRRRSSYETVAVMYAKRGDLAAAIRLVDEKFRPDDQSGTCCLLATFALERGDLPLAWVLAERAAADRSSAASAGFLRYMEAAAAQSRPDEVERGLRRALAVGTDWPEDMQERLWQDLADVLDKCGLPAQAKILADRMRHPEPPASPDWAQTATEHAEAGRFAEAMAAADREADPHQRAIALARIVRMMADARAARPEDLRRLIARAHTTAVEAVRDAEVLAATPAKPDEERSSRRRRLGKWFEPSPAAVAGETARYIAAAEAAVGDAPAMLATVGTLESDYFRLRELLTILDDKSKAADVRFARAVAEAKVAWIKPEQRGWLTVCLARAQVEAKDFAAAEETAGQIPSAARRATALLYVAQGRAQAGHTAARDAALRRADEAAERAEDEPPRRPRERVAAFQAQVLQPELVWDKAARERDPRRQVDLCLAAAEGLLDRQNGKPYWGNAE